MDAPGTDSYSFRDTLTDAIRYWELRRIPYNAVLVLVVLGNIALAWLQSRSLIRLSTLLLLFVLAVIANICYIAAYIADVLAPLSDSFVESSLWLSRYVTRSINIGEFRINECR